MASAGGLRWAASGDAPLWATNPPSPLAPVEVYAHWHRELRPNPAGGRPARDPFAVPPRESALASALLEMIRLHAGQAGELDAARDLADSRAAQIEVLRGELIERDWDLAAGTESEAERAAAQDRELTEASQQEGNAEAESSAAAASTRPPLGGSRCFLPEPEAEPQGSEASSARNVRPRIDGLEQRLRDLFSVPPGV